MAGRDDPRPNPVLIRRILGTSDESPPWTGISFTLPVDSDELADNLKHTYPHPRYTTRRQRKHIAAIDFLKKELSEMLEETSGPASSEKHNFVTPQRSQSFLDNPDVRGRQCSVSSSLSLVSTNRGASSLEHDLLRNEAQAATTAPKVTGSAQEIIFSVSDGRPMQLKTKRKMTKEEKLVYRKTRKRGACSRCRRQKGKCTHALDPSTEQDEVFEPSSTRKRSLSFDATSEEAQASKMLRPTKLLDSHTSGIDASPHLGRIPLHTPRTAHKFSIEQQPERTLEDSHRIEAVDEDVRNGQSGYVHNQNLEDSYELSIQGESILPWPNYTGVTGIQAYNSDRHQYGTFNPAGDSLRIGSIPNVSPMDFPYQDRTFSPYPEHPWQDPREYRSEDMEPT